MNFNFNATHHGSVVALACEPLSAVGVDVVCDSERPHNHFVPATLRKSSNDYEDDYDRYLSAGSSSAGGSGSKATSEVESENRRAQEEFFQSFDRSFTAAEWGAIRDAALDVEERYREFYAHWALKEAYIKAHGLGFGIELRDLSFFRRTANSGGNSAIIVGRCCVTIHTKAGESVVGHADAAVPSSFGASSKKSSTNSTNLPWTSATTADGWERSIVSS